MSTRMGLASDPNESVYIFKDLADGTYHIEEEFRGHTIELQIPQKIWDNLKEHFRQLLERERSKEAQS